MLKAIARIALDYTGFVRRHKFFGTLTSIVILAASVGGLYLIVTEFATVASLPCLTGCGG